MAERFGINVYAKLDKGQLEKALSDLQKNKKIDLAINMDVKKIEEVAKRIGKLQTDITSSSKTQNSLKQKEIDLIERARESTVLKRKEEEKILELKQSQAQNKVLEKEKQELNLQKQKSLELQKQQEIQRQNDNIKNTVAKLTQPNPVMGDMKKFYQNQEKEQLAKVSQGKNYDTFWNKALKQKDEERISINQATEYYAQKEKERLSITTDIQRQIENTVTNSNRTISEQSSQMTRKETNDYENFWKKTLNEVDSLKQKMTNLDLKADRIGDRYKGTKGISDKIKGFKQELNELEQIDGKLINKNTGLEISFGSLQGKLSQIGLEARNAQNWFTRLKDNAEKFGQYLLAGGLFVGLQQQITKGIETVNSLNKALTDARIVTGASKADSQELGSSYNQLAKDIGATTEQVASGSLEWLRQGKDAQEAQAMVKASMVESKLGAIDSAQATEYLTSVLNGYQMKSSEVMSVIDRMVAVDNSASTSVAELSEALKRTSNSASQAGVGFNDLVSYVGTVSSVTRKSAESIGSSFNTIFSRFQDIKIGGNGGFLDDGVGVAQVEEVLSKVGVKLKENETTFRNMSDVIKDLAMKWNTLNDVEQNAVSKAVSGTRNRENFLVLMNNFNMALKLQETQTNSSGLAMDRYGIYLESTEAKMNKLKATAEEFWMKTLDSDAINKFIGGLTEVIDTINSLGGLMPTIALLVGAFNIKNAGKLSQDIINIAGSIKSTIGAMSTLKSSSMITFASMETGAITTATAIQGMLGVIGLITMAISALAMGVSAYNSYQKDLINNSNQAVESFKNVSQEVNNNIKTIESFKGEYETLSKGVDENGQNISLSADAYKRYQEIVSKLVDINPSLITGYNNENQAIIDKNKSLEEQIKLEKERLKLEQMKMTSEFNKGFGARKNEISDKQKDVSDIQKQLEIAKNSVDWKAEGFSKNNLDIPYDMNLYDVDSNNILKKKSDFEQQLSIETDSKRKADLQKTIDFLNQTYLEYQSTTLGIQTELNKANSEFGMTTNKMLSDTKNAVNVILQDDISKMPQEAQKIAKSVIDNLKFDDIKNNADAMDISAQVKRSIDVAQKYSHEWKNLSGAQNEAVKYSKLYSEIAEKEGVTTKQAENIMKSYQASLVDANKSKTDFADSTKDAEKAEENFNGILVESAKKIELLKSISKDLDKHGGVSAKNTKEMVKQYPDLIGYLNDEVGMREAIKDKIKEEEETQQQAYNNMLMASDDYYKNKMLADDDWVKHANQNIENLYNSLGVAYTDDVGNYQNAEMAKAKLTEKLINQLGKGWQQYYDKISGLFIAPTSLEPSGGDQRVMDSRDMATRKGMKNKIETAVSGIKAQFNNFKFEPISIDVGGVDRSSPKKVGGSGSKKGKKSKSGSEKYAEYLEKGLEDAISIAQKKGEKLAKELEMLDSKIADTTSKGDEKLRKTLESQKANLLDKQLKNIQQSSWNMFKLRDKWVAELMKSKIPELKGLDLKKLTEEQLSQVERAFDKKIDQADKKNNNKLKASLEYSKEMVAEYGKALIETNNQISQMGHDYLTKQTEILQNKIDGINRSYDKQANILSDSNDELELHQILLNEDGVKYKAYQELKYQNAVKTEENIINAIRQLRRTGLTDDSEEIQKYLDLHRQAENTRLNLLKEMADKEREIKKQTLEKQKDYFSDYLEKVVELIKHEQDLKKESLEKEKELWTERTNAIKESLRSEQELRNYEQGLDEKNTSISKLKNELEVLQKDNSNSNAIKSKIAQKEEDLKKALKDRDNYQYDHSIETQEKMLDDELEMRTNSLDKQIKDIDEYLKQEGKIRQDAMKRIDKDGKHLFQQLLAYNRQFGDGMDSTIQTLWTNAQTAIEAYGGSAMNVLDQIEQKLKVISDEQKNVADISDRDYGERGNINTVPKAGTKEGGMSEQQAKIKEQANQAKYLHGLATQAKGNKSKLNYINKIRSDWGIDQYGGIKQVGKVPNDIWAKKKKIYGFSEGGEQSTTGLAMIHGTTDKPERILSAEQTESFNNLVPNISKFNEVFSSLMNITPKNNDTKSLTIQGNLVEFSGQINKDVDVDSIANQTINKINKAFRNSGLKVNLGTASI